SQPLASGFLPFRANYPPGRGSPITWGLSLEELPRLRVPSELFFVPALQFASGSLVRILHGFLLVAPGKSLESWRCHSSEPLQFAHALDVYRAPKTLQLAGGEAVGVTDIIDTPFYSVDPAETECFIHGFRIAHADFARLFLVEPNPKLVDFVVIRYQPFSKVRRRLEKRNFHDKLRPAECGN